MPPPPLPTQTISSSVSLPDAVPSAPIVLPTIPKKRLEITKAATAAQQRSRSASVSSNNSTTSDSSTGSTSSSTSAGSGSSVSSARSAIDSSYKESAAFALDNVAQMLLDPNTNRLEFAELILELPVKTSHTSGWCPGLASVQRNGEHHCPRCQISLTELVKSYSGLKSPAAKLSKMKKHIVDYTASHIKQEAMPAIISSYKQDQPCPVCMAHQDNVEEDAEFLEDTGNPK